MNPNRRFQKWAVFLCAAALLLCLTTSSANLTAQQPASQAPSSAASTAAAEPDRVCDPAELGSPYIPVDSWVYSAMWRLYALGYVDTVYLGMRPWTRASVLSMLEESGAQLESDGAASSPAADQAQSIYDALNRYLLADQQGPCGPHRGSARVESVYSAARGISGTPLRDSYHLGQSIINDYGRPYANGFNNYSGVSGYASAGRFALYLRTEFQGTPFATGYSPALVQQLAEIDDAVNPVTGLAYPNQATIPGGPINSFTDGRFLEAYVSWQLLNHVISFGKHDEWLGPAQGGSFAYSDNAQNIYGFQINRIEPLHVPGLSRITGPFRYEFLVGQMRGHDLMPNPLYLHSSPQPNVISPGNPWLHLEKISFRPTENLEFGFERTALWGGKGHSPVNLKSFLRSFFSAKNTDLATKFGPTDPGARFGAFDFSYRLPFVRNWLTLYADGEVHDDVSPIDAPRRASWRPGIYLSHVPGLPRLDARVEAVTTDPPVGSSHGGVFMYYEALEKQGYTNQGQIFGDWIGREDKGGQAWLTWHLNGNEWIQVSTRNQKAAKDFIPGGTTLNDASVQVVKRVARDLELNGNFTYERWKAPVYLPGEQIVTVTTIQLTWYPQRRVSF